MSKLSSTNNPITSFRHAPMCPKPLQRQNNLSTCLTSVPTDIEPEGLTNLGDPDEPLAVRTS